MSILHQSDEEYLNRIPSPLVRGQVKTQVATLLSGGDKMDVRQRAEDVLPWISGLLEAKGVQHLPALQTVSVRGLNNVESARAAGVIARIAPNLQCLELMQGMRVDFSETLGAFLTAVSGNQMQLQKLKITAVEPLKGDVVHDLAGFLQGQKELRAVQLENLALGECSEGFAPLAAALTPLQGKRRLLSLQLSSNGLEDRDIAGLVKVINHHPELVALDLSENRFGSQGLLDLFDGIQGHPGLRKVSVANNRLVRQPGQVVDYMLESLPQLRSLDVQHIDFPPEEMETLVDALAGNRTLREFFANCDWRDARQAADFSDDFLIANPALVHAVCTDNLQSDGITDIFAQKLGEKQKLNLRSFAPAAPSVSEMLTHNDRDCTKAREYNSRDIQSLSAGELRFLDQRRYAVIGWDRSVHPEFRNEEAEYEGFIAGLPSFPKPGELTAETLFAKNTDGYAPIDNPRPFEKPENREALWGLLCQTPALKNRYSAHEGGILPVLAEAMGMKALVERLNGQGISLTPDDLLLDNNRPNVLLQERINAGDALHCLFMSSNVTDWDKSDMRRLYSVLPEQDRARITNFHTLVNRPDLRQQPASRGWR